jgi:pantoate--beta-alanine ligase
MVHDLNFPVEIVGCPIVREPDGLAMSSRNAYLDSDQRKAALVLQRALTQIETRFRQGKRGPSQLVEAGKQAFANEPSARLDYLEVVTPDTLDAIDEITGPALVAVAAYLGSTRLIDNVLLEAGL